MNYTEKYYGDFTIVDISDIKVARSGKFYREILFDKHPNKMFRNNPNIDVAPVREFHADETNFIELNVGQTLHNVTILAKRISKSLPGYYYTLCEFDDNIVAE